jgi:hypothetical protein
MNDCRRIEAAALIRPVTAKNQFPAPSVPATVVDVTANGLGLRVDPGADVTPNRMIELGIDGHWTRGRVIWSGQGIHNAVIAGIELTEPGAVINLLSAQEPRVALAS